MELKQFLELFNPLPGNHYIQITTKVDETTIALRDLLKNVDGEFHLVVYLKDEASIVFPEVKLQIINKLDSPFRALPRDNDMVIFKDIFQAHSNQDMLLRIAYTTLANTANIIIMEKKGTINIEETKELLEKFEFRAPNEIDILDEYDLIIAKKMHMWGNGL